MRQQRVGTLGFNFSNDLIEQKVRCEHKARKDFVVEENIMLDSTRLDELGERRIINEILRPRYGKNASDRFGDDCAVVLQTDALPGRVVVATTDPCPEPVASILGYNDLYYRGWLLATINLSDLAASGAKPLGLLTSLILPNELSVGALTRLLDGIDECCRVSGTRVLGGNIKEGARIDLTATAIGSFPQEKGLSRHGCSAGDLLVIVGDLGLFWAGVTGLKQGVPFEHHEGELLRNILTPTPKVKVGRAIADKGVLTACIDNSDGLYPSLAQLAEINKLQIRISFDDVMFSSEVQYISALTGIASLRFALGWGDWQLIGCCRTENLEDLRNIVMNHSCQLHVIGEVGEGTGVLLRDEISYKPMAPIDSQRFTADSWFTTGLDAYIKELTEGPLWASA
jgi:thiamine-monophosphate kinase